MAFGGGREGHDLRMTKQHPHGAELRLVEDQAVRWVQKLVSGEATPDEIEAAGHWRRQDPAHEAAFEAAEQVWRELGAARQALHDPKADYAGMLDALGQRRKTVSRRAVLGGGVAVVA